MGKSALQHYMCAILEYLGCKAPWQGTRGVPSPWRANGTRMKIKALQNGTNHAGQARVVNFGVTSASGS